MTPPIEHRTVADGARQEQASLTAGRAAGYCWVPNPDDRGRCTWPPNHPWEEHKDVYARTEW